MIYHCAFFLRLDRTVSGVLLFARSKEVAKALSNLFRRNQVEKKYIARVKVRTDPFL